MRSSTSATRVGPPCGATLSHQRRVPPNRIGGPSRGSTSDGGQHPWNLDGKAVDATLANPSGPRSRSHAQPGLDLAIRGTSCHPALLFSGPSHDMARTAHAGRVRSREVGVRAGCRRGPTRRTWKIERRTARRSAGKRARISVVKLRDHPLNMHRHSQVALGRTKDRPGEESQPGPAAESSDRPAGPEERGRKEWGMVQQDKKSPHVAWKSVSPRRKL